MTERRNVYIRIHSPVSNYNLYTKVYNFEWLSYNIVLDGNWLGNQEDVLVKLVYSLLCAAVLLYTAVFAGLGCTIREQANQFDMLTKQAQSGSVEAETAQTAVAEPADETAAEEAAIEPEPEVRGQEMV